MLNNNLLLICSTLFLANCAPMDNEGLDVFDADSLTNQTIEPTLNLDVSALSTDHLSIKNESDKGKCLEEDNLVENGSFECSNVKDSGWDIFPEVFGWKADLNQRHAAIEIQCGGIGGLKSIDGVCHMEIDSHLLKGFKENDAVVFQELKTIEGSCYKLSLNYSPRSSNNIESNLVYLSFDDKMIDKLYSESIGWKKYEYTVQAKSKKTRLEFKGLVDVDSLGGQIDNVRVEEIPCDKEEGLEPSEETKDSKDNKPDFENVKECPEVQVMMVWGDILGGMKQWNNFDQSFIRVLNKKAKMYSPDLIRFDKHDRFKGSDVDNRQVNFDTRVITHYDGLTLRAQACGKENPVFGISLGGKFERKFEIDQNDFFHVAELEGPSILKGHQLMIYAIKAPADKLQFFAGNHRPRGFDGKLAYFKGVFAGDLVKDGDDNGRFAGLFGVSPQGEFILQGNLRSKQATYIQKLIGKYAPSAVDGQPGPMKGEVRNSSGKVIGIMQGRWFNQHKEDKIGTYFGYILRN